MGKKTVENILQAALRDGEQVLWQGRPEAFSILANDAKGQILGKWIGTIIAAIIILVLYTMEAGGDSIGVLAGIPLVAAALMISPFIEQWNIMGQRYYITNQRVIQIAKDQAVYFVELPEIDGYQAVKDQTEYGSLVFGSCICEDIKRQLRWCACHPETDSQRECLNGWADGLALFNLKDCDGAEKVLSQLAVKAD